MFARFSKRQKKKPNWAIHTSAALALQRGVRADTYTGSVYYALHISVDTPGATPCLEPYMERVYASVFLPAQANRHLLCCPPNTNTHECPCALTQSALSNTWLPHVKWPLILCIGGLCIIDLWMRSEITSQSKEAILAFCLPASA